MISTRRILPVGVALALSGCGMMTPPGPREVAFENTAGIRIAIQAGAEGDPVARLEQASAQLAERLGPALPGAPVATAPATGGNGTFATLARSYTNNPGVVHLFLTSSANRAICAITAAPSEDAKAVIPEALKRCVPELARGVSLPTARTAEQAQGASGAGANWAAVEGVYFRSTTGFGVGGMVTVEFEPIILLTDGSYYMVDDAAFEDVDLASERSAHPRRFGRWTKSGSSYSLSEDDHNPVEYEIGDGSFFPAFPAPAGETIAATYERISGGGNSAMGGEMTIAVSNDIRFGADGQFATGSSMGAIGSGAQSGVGTAVSGGRRATSGRYTLDRHLLTLRYDDGRTERRFFAYGAQGTPPRTDRDMLFMGDRVYTKDD